ncbi:hypothetical protein [Weissella viridescens]|uniref:hypothetical protein n=1 Tax=Weissella viridescens TaxID=1629 RepID=UPI003AF24CE8
MLSNYTTLLTSYPGPEKLGKWDDSWTNTLKFWSKDGEKAGSVASTKDGVINFFISNQPYFQADSAMLVMATGFIQNAWYNMLYGLAWVSNSLIKAALAPLYYLPKMLMDPNSPLHVLYYMCVGFGVSFVILSVLVAIPRLTRKQGALSGALGNSLFTIGMLFILPFIIATAGEFTQNTLSKSLGSGTTSMAAAPMVDNTVDVEKWALNGFDKKPFSKGAPLYNNLEKADRPIPDFTSVVDKDDVELINNIAKKKGITKDGTPVKDVGKVFQYAPKISPQNDKEDRPQYSLEKLSLEKGITHINDKEYKRFRVQNFPATVSYLIIIAVGALFAIKIMRSSIGSYINLLGTVVASGRDAAKSAEPIKKSTMEILNSFVGIFLDVFMLYLFTYLSSTLPNQIASDYSGLLHGLIYAMVLGILAIMTYNGSSAIEKQFGMTPGARGQGGIARSLGMPGMMLGSAAAGMIADKQRQKRNENVLNDMKKGDEKAAKEQVDSPNPDSTKAEKAAQGLDDDGDEETSSTGTQGNSSTANSTQENTGGTDSTDDSAETNGSDGGNDSGAASSAEGEAAARGLDDDGSDSEEAGQSQDPGQADINGELSGEGDSDGDATSGMMNSDEGGDALDRLDADEDGADNSVPDDSDGAYAASQLDDDLSDDEQTPLSDEAGETAADNLEDDLGDQARNMPEDEGQLDDSGAEPDGYAAMNDGQAGESASSRLNDYDEGATGPTNANPSGRRDYSSANGRESVSNNGRTNVSTRGQQANRGGRGRTNDAVAQAREYLKEDDVRMQKVMQNQERRHKMQSQQQNFAANDQRIHQMRRQKNIQRVDRTLRDLDQGYEDPTKPVD